MLPNIIQFANGLTFLHKYSLRSHLYPPDFNYTNKRNSCVSEIYNPFFFNMFSKISGAALPPAEISAKVYCYSYQYEKINGQLKCFAVFPSLACGVDGDGWEAGAQHRRHQVRRPSHLPTNITLYISIG